MDKAEQLLEDQLRLFDDMWWALERENDELIENCGLARNLACSEWTEAAIPTPFGLRTGLRTNKLRPDLMELLKENKAKILEDIGRRKKVLVQLFEPIAKAANRKLSSDQLACLEGKS